MTWKDVVFRVTTVRVNTSSFQEEAGGKLASWQAWCCWDARRWLSSLAALLWIGISIIHDANSLSHNIPSNSTQDLLYHASSQPWPWFYIQILTAAFLVSIDGSVVIEELFLQFIVGKMNDSCIILLYKQQKWWSFGWGRDMLKME